jgi:hypothetical protein
VIPLRNATRVHLVIGKGFFSGIPDLWRFLGCYRLYLATPSLSLELMCRLGLAFIHS